MYVLKNHAKYLAKELLVQRGKGSDASNKHDEEAEEEYFSDDQEVKPPRERGNYSTSVSLMVRWTAVSIYR